MPMPIISTFGRALNDPNLFGPSLQGQKSWAAWKVFLAALFAEGADEAAQAGTIGSGPSMNDVAHLRPSPEAAVIVGRRGGKSRTLAAGIAVYLACFRSYEQFLAIPGEVATIGILAVDKGSRRGRSSAISCLDY